MKSSAKSFFSLCIGLIFVASGCKSTLQEKQVTPAAPETRSTSQPGNTVLPPTTSALQSVYEDQSQALLPGAQTVLASLPDLPHYTIDVRIDTTAHAYAGHALVELANTESQSLDSLFFRLLPNGGQGYGNGALKVSQTRENGSLAETNLSVDDTVLQGNLSQDLLPGERIKVDFDFQGKVPVDFGGEQTPWAYGIYNISQGVLALSGWYPILAVYDDEGWHLDPVSPLGDSVFSETALYTVDITLPDDQVLAATGVEVGRQPSGDQTKYQLVSGPVRDFFIAASPYFQVVSQTVEGTHVNAYFLPGYDSAAAVGLSAAARSLDIYNRRFGSYPFTELDVVQAPLQNALGVEYPGIVLIGASLYDEADDPSFTVTVAHEVAHQWWYNLVGNDVFAEPWLDEGLATYSSSVYEQDELGEGAYKGLVSYWQGRYDTLVKQGKDDVVIQDLSHFEGLGDPQVYSGVVYTKAALFFEAVRRKIGDKAFFAALQAYYKEYQFRVATRDGLLADFNDASGKQLDAMYQEWLYSEK